MDVFFGLFFLSFFALSIGGTIAWILAIVEIAKLPDHQFKAVGTEKVTWILVVALLGWVGALIWFFGRRNDVRAASGHLPSGGFVATIAPGWYPDQSGSLRWWDGRAWTHHEAPVPEQPAPPTNW